MTATAGAIATPTLEGRLPSSSRADIDASLDTLRRRRGLWADLSILERIELLRRLRASFAEIAEEWVEACMEAEDLRRGQPSSGEEWIVGPYLVLRNLRLLQVALRNISVGGRPRIPGPVRPLADGRAAAQVFPFDTWDRLFYPGVTGEVWMQEGVTLENLPDHQASAYFQDRPGEVALVLSAGNVSSIGPMDALYELFVERRVVVYKTHEVNDYLGPLLERGFRPLIEAGFFRVVYGGVEEGSYLCNHPTVDKIHITGSDKTYEAIVFGPGPEGEARRARGEKQLETPVSAELGNVSPILVVPGRWTRSELLYQAENIATMLANNAGFNCIAARVIITHRQWAQRQELLDAVRDVLRRLPPRRAYYPGAHRRWEAFVAAHPEAERFGGPAPDELPWTLIADLDPEASDEICFTQEAFCGLFSETSLPADDPADFVRRAVAFANDRLWGTLSANLLVHPSTADAPALRDAVEDALRDLRYGSVAVNHWAGIAYGVVVTPWGAFPGHPATDIQSGTGFVHNTLMFDRPEKTVFRAPFRARPKPPWFLSHARAYELGRRLSGFETSPAVWKLPGIFRYALSG